MRNYKLTNNTIDYNGITLYQIEAINDFNGVKKGTLGGYIQSRDNLSGDAWVGDNAKVYGDAWVYGKAKVYGNAWVYGKAGVYGDARVGDNAQVYDNARVLGKAGVYGDAWVYGNAKVYDDARVGYNAWVGDDAWVYGNAKVCDNARVLGKARVSGEAIVTRSVFNIHCVYNLTMTDNHILYGCIQKTIEEWKQFLDSDEVIETPRDTNMFKRIQNTLEFVIRKHELDRPNKDLNNK